MDLNQATEVIAAYLKETFGKVVALREVTVERRSSGRVWMGTAYCITSRGDVEVGQIGVTEGGDILGELGVDQLVEVLLTFDETRRVSERPTAVIAPTDEDFSDVTREGDQRDADDLGSMMAGEGEDDIDAFFQELDSSRLKGRIIGLLASGRESELLEARRLMPKLLVEHDQRGEVLRQMGELELRLGNTGHGVGYLAAAAREFADLADVQALEEIVALTADTDGTEDDDHQTPKHLLEQTKARRNPVKELSEVPAFKGLGAEDLKRLADLADLVNVAQGETLLEEGSEAKSVYIIQSGNLAVHLETPGGEGRVVRCCLPGELVGESSLLETERPTCNATITAREASQLWCFDGGALKDVLEEVPDLRARIEAKRTIHRLDSFFSMNEATNTLDVRVRDKLLGCISTIRYARAGEVLESEGALPSTVYLLVTGRIEYQRPKAAVRIYGPDSFVCLKDTLHELPLSGDMVATEPCRLVTFDPDALRRLAVEAPPEVVAVLDRLE